MLLYGAANWQLTGQFISTRETKTALPSTLTYTFRKRILKVSTKSISTPKIKVKESWRKAGYLVQLVGNIEVVSRVIPLNQETIIAFPLVKSYSVRFTPVRWLPNLTVKVYEYKGAETDELIEELLII